MLYIDFMFISNTLSVLQYIEFFSPVNMRIVFQRAFQLRRPPQMMPQSIQTLIQIQTVFPFLPRAPSFFHGFADTVNSTRESLILV